MKADLYLDVLSPFAYFLDVTLRRAPLPLPLKIKPILLSAVLNANGQKGPAEIAKKRAFTYRFCLFRADELGIPLTMPKVHPYNPLPWLRLILAAPDLAAATSAVFDAMFVEGIDPNDPQALERVGESQGIADVSAAIQADSVKQQLRANTEEAIARGVFGVPTIMLDEELYFGFDALPMLRARLANAPIFASPAMSRIEQIPIGAVRKS
jgi:2-hydroxychromene-2-carboxylate isomerase